jgi:hypothetical protein
VDGIFGSIERHFNTPEEYKTWNENAEELLANLLFEMGKSLGFTFDKVTIIKRNVHTPSGHVETEKQNETVRELLIRFFKEKTQYQLSRYSPKKFQVQNNKAVEKTTELQSLLIDHYKNGTPINVVLSKNE